MNRNMWTELNDFALSLYTRAMMQCKDFVAKSEEGQALVEYALILSLIAVVAVTALTNIGNEVRERLEAVASGL